MLRDDPQIGRMYHCLITTICQSCSDQCGGGTQCLMTYIISNVITLVINLLSGGDISYVFHYFGTFTEPRAWDSPLYGFYFFLLAVCIIGVYTSQICGSWFGYQAYKEVRDSGVTQSGGAWASGGGGPVGGYPTARESREVPVPR
eukprot:CAMPEP_0115763968 /NCGR_PEP_ID=MMETSP0272-20121206/101821_1 /TAXON_ID=71861 /ORGANISM="Scrippsiella trochoidea, Strain CCMP3099" /LENGTH=144 /DNA_ID=CAMNT_0003209747 /DNA_START=268 /DNA_END=698 /DNA_ORIENTATION=+